MPGCAAIGCNNRSEKGFTMKCFPRDPALRNIWKQRVGRADWEPSNNSFLCHVHFDTSQWISATNGKVRLKKGAIPSIFTVTSTRKSPKKRLKAGTQNCDDTLEDLEEYELEYSENDGSLILNVQTHNAETIGGPILQNIKILSSETLKSLQTENIIIVSDENDGEVGKIISENGINVTLEETRGKENVQLVPLRPEKSTSEVKVEVKEELLDNGVSSQEYEEIERKLQEICHSSNETDSGSNDKDLRKKSESTCTDTESSFSLEDSENGLDKNKEKSNVQSSRLKGTKRKRKSKPDSVCTEEANQALGKLSEETQFEEAARDIIDDLEAENSQDCGIPKSKHTVSPENGLCKPSTQSKVIVEAEKSALSTVSSIKNLNKPMTLEQLNAKLSLQAEVIERLSGQLIMYKDMERKVKTLSQELSKKNREIESLTVVAGLKVTPLEKKYNGVNANASDFDLKSKVDYLEDSLKELTKSLNLETQNRRKLESQVRSRNNQIKDLNWKLDKASKFLDRAERNSKNYQKRMLSLQSLLRRKKLLSEKTSPYNEFVVCHSSNQSFTDKALERALEIERVCGIEGYQKLLDCKFPLPSLKELNKKYPDEVEYYEAENEELVSIQDKNVEISMEDCDKLNDANAEVRETEVTSVHESVNINIKMENVEYLELECLNENLNETVVQTVQDLFDECSDNEDLNLNELRRHLMCEENIAT